MDRKNFRRFPNFQRKKLQRKALYEQIVNEAETILLWLIDNEGELSNCLSINHLVEETIIFIKQKQNAAKREFFAVVLNMKIDSLRF